MLRNRTLGFTELRAALTLEYNDDKIVVVTLCKGNLDLFFLKKAWRHLFIKHPHLRCAVRKNKNNYYLEENIHFDQVKFTLCHCNEFNIDIFNQHIQSKLQDKLIDTEALWRVNLFTFANDRAALMLEFHHAIADGISTAHLMHDFFVTYFVLKNGNSLEEKIKLWLPSIEDILEKYTPSFENYQVEVQKTLYDDKRNLFQPSEFENKRPIALHDRQARFFLMTLALDPIITASKLNAVTVNTLLTTLVLLAMFSLKSRENITENILLSTAVNLRKYDNHLSSEDLATFYSVIMNCFRDFSKKNNFQEVCKKVQCALMTSIQLTAKTPHLPEKNARARVRQAIGMADQVKENNTYFQGSIATSNLGKVPLEKTYGTGENKIEIEAYILFVNQILGFCEIVPNITTFNDKIFINFTYVWPLHQNKWALDFALEFLRAAYAHIHHFHFHEEWTSKEINNPFKPNLKDEYKIWKSYQKCLYKEEKFIEIYKESKLLLK